MSARIIPVAQLSAAELDRWRELAAAAVEPNPFFEPEFLLPAARAIPTDGLGLLVAEQGGDWQAAAPVHGVRRWHRVPVPGLVTWFHSYCFLGTPLVRAGDLEAALAELVTAATKGRAAGFFGLDAVAADGPVMAALGEVLGTKSFEGTRLRRVQRALLERRADGAYLQLKPKRRREYRRQRDRLGEQLGGPVETRDLSSSSTSVDEFLRIEASGWKGAAGTAFASIEGHDRFFAEICSAFEQSGRLQLLALGTDERTVAMLCSLRAGEGLFSFKIAFDETWARYSPGILIELDSIDLFHSDPVLEWFDSCADPGNEMINRLWPDRRALATIAVTRRLTGTLSRGAFRFAATRVATKGAE